MSQLHIRDVQTSDFNEIKRLNDDFVHFTSPMSLARIAELDNLSFYHRVICDENRVLGFLLVMSDGASYNSDNYQWFAQRLSQFAYIDRIVIEQNQQGKKLGQKLYSDLFNYARNKGIEFACCEYNLLPENPISAKFHAQLGFEQMDTLTSSDGKKVLSMQTRLLNKI
jgi:predicted GNAT superfamily acetyltransferase